MNAPAADERPPGRRGVRARRVSGVVVLAGGLLVWLVVLPWLGEQSTIRAHIQAQQERGIDPSAMFYSELEIVPAIAHRVERLSASPEAPFWSRPLKTISPARPDAP